MSFSRNRLSNFARVLALLLAHVCVSAQSLDLVVDEAVVLAETKGLRIDRQRWYWQEQSGWAWRAWLDLPGDIGVVSSEEPQDFDDFLPGDRGPWAAINGGFYDVDGTAMGLVVSQGVTRSPFRRGGGSGILEVHPDGPRIIHHSRFQPGAVEAIQSIDRIVADNRVLVNMRPNARVAARSGVGVSDRFLVLVLIADNRSMLPTGPLTVQLHGTSSYGLPLWAFARYLRDEVGVVDALNLDGSVSAHFAAQVGDREIRINGLRGTVNALVVRP